MVKIRNRKTITLVGLTVLLVSSFSTPNVAYADVIQPNECFPAVLMLKGSGEGEFVNPNGADYTPSNSTNGESFIHTNGHEGPVLGKALQAFVNQTNPADTVSKVRFIGIDYPALPVAPTIPDMPGVPENTKAVIAAGIWTNHIMAYNDSYHAGAQKTVDFIKKDQQRGCNTQYMLMSYSQGVISARLAIGYMGNNPDKIISSYVVGDPFQKANGTSSERQFSDANTSPDSDGIGRIAVDTLIKASELNPLSDKVALAGLKYYRDSIIGSDPVVYRDDTAKGEVSRSLCHYFDPTCDPSLSPLFVPEFPVMEQHTRYFDPDHSSGAIDLNFEISEFDKQVKALANSTEANPRERVLTKSPSLVGGTTSYNVANARPDDKCSWDKGSDGTNELVNVPCEIHTIANGSGDVKMTVTVTDSFGIQYTLGSESSLLDPKIVDEISNLDPNTWYQFKSYSDAPQYPWEEGYKDPWEEGYEGSYCLKWYANPYSEIDTDFSYLQNESYCGYPQYSTSAHSSPGVFKAEAYQTPQGKKVRIVSGYDSDFAWTKSDYNNEIKISSINSDSDQSFTPKLTSILNDKTYYSFRSGNDCVTVTDEYSASKLLPCNPANNKQLFEAIPMSNSSSIPYGAFSVEKDTMAPTDVTGLRVEIDSANVNLRWNYSDDVRTAGVDYEVYKKNSTTNALEYVGTMWHYTIFPINLSNTSIGDLNTYEVSAVDAAGNRSTPSTITFATPPSISKPLIPSAVVASNKYSVQLSFPAVNNPLVTGIRIYDGQQVIGNIPITPNSTNNFVDYNVRPNIGDRLYSYELVISDNVTSVRSDTLRVSLR